MDKTVAWNAAKGFIASDAVIYFELYLDDAVAMMEIAEDLKALGCSASVDMGELRIKVFTPRRPPPLGII